MTTDDTNYETANLFPQTITVLDIVPRTNPHAPRGSWELPEGLITQYLGALDWLKQAQQQVFDYLKETGQHIPSPFPGHEELETPTDFEIPIYNQAVDAVKFLAPQNPGSVTWADLGVGGEEVQVVKVPKPRKAIKRTAAKKATKKTAAKKPLKKAAR